MRRKVSRLIVLICALITVSAGAAQWEDSLASLLNEFQDCQAPVKNDDPCYTVTARAAMAVYGIEDFKTESGEAMGVEEMIATVKAGWSDLGQATQQEALNAAQQAANEGKAVVAVFEEPPVGHAVVVLPGELAPSGKWAAQVPNSASFFLNNPGRSYVGKTLAYAFKDKNQVRLYVKK